MGEVERLIAKGWTLADGDPSAEARLTTAEAFNSDEADPATDELVERAIALARRAGDLPTESAALDQLDGGPADPRRGPRRSGHRPSATELWRRCGDGRHRDGVVRRDSHGRRLRCRRRRSGDRTTYVRTYSGSAVLSRRGSLASGRLLLVTFLAGDWSETLGLAERFREGWERAGRPRAGTSPAARMQPPPCTDCAATTKRAIWLQIVARHRDARTSLGRDSSRRILRRDVVAAPRPADRGVELMAPHRTSSTAGSAACGAPGTAPCGPRPRYSAGPPTVLIALKAHARQRMATGSPPPSSTGRRLWSRGATATD